jgi:hypothetical protein
MRKLNMGWVFGLAMALAIPSVSAAYAAGSKAEKADEAAAAPAAASKDDQEKMKEHMKLRTEIKKVKYPAAKAIIVSKVKGVKADDKKWFAETLPDKTYASADEVYSALGWEATPPPAAK